MAEFWTNPTLLTWAGLISVAMFVITLTALPPIVAYLPEDYFVRRRRTRTELGLTGWAWLIGKNLLGWLLIIMGLSMLVLPGQGLLTVLVGIMLINFPGKRGAERWLVQRPRVLAALNWMRNKASRPPLRVNDEPGSKASSV